MFHRGKAAQLKARQTGLLEARTRVRSMVHSYNVESHEPDAIDNADISKEAANRKALSLLQRDTGWRKAELQPVLNEDYSLKHNTRCTGKS